PVKIGMFSQSLQNGTEGRTLYTDPNYGMGVNLPSETKTAYGVMAAMQMSLAHATNVSELWFHIGAQGGVIKPEGQFIFNVPSGVRTPARLVDVGTSLTGSINAGLLKKFYVKRFGLVLQVDAKYALLRLSGDNPVTDGPTYSMTNSRLGGDLRAGLETYISPKVMFGVAAEYNLFGAGDEWTVKVTDKDDKELLKKEDVKGPEVNFGGLGIYAWINIAIPSFN
ncbi:MAG TPA: hypothetical protein VK470_03150, partial [Bacteroidota bacterium]|nr:hypothetical protein [Bacteroidota bacterium]